MSDQEVVRDWRRAASQLANKLRGEMSVPVIGRITQLTETKGIPVNDIQTLELLPRRPNWEPVRISPMYNLYVYRQGGQAYMILTRLDPFHYEHVALSELEMQTIMVWAGKMVSEGIGMFTPADGGWTWWRK